MGYFNVQQQFANSRYFSASLLPGRPATLEDAGATGTTRTRRSRQNCSSLLKHLRAYVSRIHIYNIYIIVIICTINNIRSDDDISWLKTLTTSSKYLSVRLRFSHLLLRLLLLLLYLLLPPLLLLFFSSASSVSRNLFIWLLFSTAVAFCIYFCSKIVTDVDTSERPKLCTNVSEMFCRDYAYGSYYLKFR